MRQSTRLTILLFVLLLPFSACQTQPAPDTRATDETAIRNIDVEWAKAATAKDVDRTVSYYSDDASVMPPNNPLVTGKAPVHALWKNILGAPGFAGGWKPLKVEVARASDLAYVTGTYEFAQSDASGKPMVDKGKYVEVWKKQADGGWKCVADIFNSDLPAATPPIDTKTAAAKNK
jgi:Ketosteroid isomerase homolog